MSRRPADQAHTLTTDATTIATLITPTLHNLDLGTAGFPTTTPGAAPATAHGSRECPNPDCNQSVPCPTHDTERIELGYLHTADDKGHEFGHLPTAQTTTTERLALQRDNALDDLDALHDHLRQAAYHAKIAARICTRWGYAGLTDTAIKAKLRSVDALIWCEHCSKLGRHQTRAKDRTECDPCIDFRTRYKRAPDTAQYDAYDARGGRWEPQTVHRIMKRTDDERKAKQAAERAQRRANEKQAKEAS